jgi:phage terminase large subunit GpA-like protein
VKGLSRIERAFERSDQRYYHVACPHCGEFAPILWRNLRWDEGQPETAALYCESCGAEIAEQHKEELLAGGKWMRTQPDSEIRGYHLSGLYSPLGWYSWADAVTDFLEAKRIGPEGMKTWVNTVLGETWKESGETVEEDAILARCESYPAAVPAAAVALTAGIDVQDDRIEMEVVGWAEGEESWGVDYKVLYGDPGQSHVWQLLEEALSEFYDHENGHRIKVAAACIDSGHATQQVYEFAKRRRPRPVYAIKGMAGTGRPIVSAPSKRKTGRAKRPVTVFLAGVDEAKTLLYSRLRITEPGPGYCHFPIHAAHDVEYFKQLTAEKAVTRFTRGFPRREWVKVRSRNEALDCRVYAMAALYLLKPSWAARAKRLGPGAKKIRKPRVRKKSVAQMVYEERKRGSVGRGWPWPP